MIQSEDIKRLKKSLKGLSRSNTHCALIDVDVDCRVQREGHSIQNQTNIVYGSLKNQNWVKRVQNDFDNFKMLLSNGAEQKVKQSKIKSIKNHHGGNEKVWTQHFFLFGYVQLPPAKCCAMFSQTSLSIFIANQVSDF